MADQEKQNWLEKPTTPKRERSKFLLGKSANVGRAAQQESERQQREQGYQMFSNQEDPNYPKEQGREEEPTQEDSLEKQIAYTVGGGTMSLPTQAQASQQQVQQPPSRQRRQKTKQKPSRKSALQSALKDVIIKLPLLGIKYFLGLLSLIFAGFLEVILLPLRFFIGLLMYAISLLNPKKKQGVFSIFESFFPLTSKVLSLLFKRR